ncbi:MAG: helix-turn-helix transcriptional regulator [Clostridia bacterium]|nr:helix-turn-helix transcriptional regulator [Clostridia bacterium]
MNHFQVNIFNKNERSDFSDFNCHFWKGKSVKNHSHSDYYEVNVTTKGKTVNVINGISHVQEKGVVTILCPNSSHSLILDENSEHYNIAIKKRYFDSLLQNKNSLKTFLEERSYITHVLSEKVFDYVYYLILQIDNNSYDSYNHSLVESVLHALICEILSEFKVQAFPSKISEYCNDAIKNINNGAYVSMQATEIHSLYPVSHTYFIKEFKKITGKTLISYLQRKKLEYAKTLLLTTDYSVLHVSALLNYDSLSYFIRIFKNEYGLTPYQYRKNNVGNIFSK